METGTCMGGGRQLNVGKGVTVPKSKLSASMVGGANVGDGIAVVS